MALMCYYFRHLRHMEKFTKTGKVLHESGFRSVRKRLILLAERFGAWNAINKADEVAHRVTRMRISARVRLQSDPY